MTLLDKYKSSAGFAVGFNEKLSIENAVFEAIERYILQQWTDGIISLEKFDVILENNLAKTFFEKFDQIQFLKKRVNTKFKDLEIDFQIIVCIAFKGDGIFWGSKAHFNENKCIQHSLIEAFRNLNVFNNLNKSNIFEVSYVDDVIFHFGSGK